jgi:hypothetical protein
VEAILAALTTSNIASKKCMFETGERGATGVSEVDRRNEYRNMGFVYGTNTPHEPRRFYQSDSGVVKRSDSSVLLGRNSNRYTQDASLDDDPRAAEYGYSLVECWVAEIDRTHLRSCALVSRKTS